MLNIQPRPAQVVVDLTADHVERANLWIPEIVEVGASGAFLPFAKSPEHPVAWIREEAKSRYDLRLPGLLSLSASVQADESGFALEIEIGNSAAEDWGEVHACICLQLTPAASFLDGLPCLAILDLTRMPVFPRRCALSIMYRRSVCLRSSS